MVDQLQGSGRLGDSGVDDQLGDCQGVVNEPGRRLTPASSTVPFEQSVPDRADSVDMSGRSSSHPADPSVEADQQSVTGQAG
ncbi:MAG: hypothetical protein IPN02_07585 [Candidatus Microthrix sp.]|uniref:Uncharacterized protein n=1 Tax=Candidatus Neomicrothrix subdominans TaxID=2954438 RepID=A0A936NAH5_9ACTN|nr:hypothetical protein [Candidatus Microthrix subdominans]